MKDSKIPWTDHTFNPWVGCEAVSEGCGHCYAQAMVRRFGRDFAVRTVTGAMNWEQPYRWNLKAMKEGRREKVFCGSMCDWLDARAKPAVFAMLLGTIAETPQLDWLLLTKRPENWRWRMEELVATQDMGHLSRMVRRWIDGNPPGNVWVGVTAENMERWNERVDVLAEIPALVRFVSVEPMLGPVMPEQDDHTVVNWVIAGGENGNRARTCASAWIRSLGHACHCQGIPFFFKGWGERSDLRAKGPNEVEIENMREWPNTQGQPRRDAPKENS